MRTRHNVLPILIAVLAAGACSDEADTPQAPVLNETIRYSNAGPQTQKYLPYGVPVPVGTSINAPPEPYNPSRHGPPIPNTQVGENLVGRPDFSELPKRIPEGVPVNAQLGSRPADPPGTEDHGISLRQTTKPWYGVSQVNDVQLNMWIPVSQDPTNPWSYLYAPTLLPPGGSCIEVTTVHRRHRSSSTVTHLQGWYDWCESNASLRWKVLEEMNATFQTKYVRTYNGEPTVAISVVTPNTGHTMGQCWFGVIYNYQVGGWEQKFSSCGTTYIPLADQTHGWTAWEAWRLTAAPSYCPFMDKVRAMDIQYADPDLSAFRPFTNYPSDYIEFAGGATAFCWWPIGYYWYFAFPPFGMPPNTWQAQTGWNP